MNMPADGNGWDEWGRHIRMEIERQGDCLCRLQEMMSGIRSDLSALKIQAGIWGAIAGLIPAAVAILYILLKQGR